MNPMIRLLLATSLSFALACAPGAQELAPDDRGPVIARVGGEDVHQGDLDAWLKDDLFEQATAGKDAAALYELHSEALDRMIASQLLEAETERQGVEIDALHSLTVAEATVSDAEVQAFYQTNQERMEGQSFEAMAPRIRQFLESRAQAETWSKFVGNLHDQAGVEILLEAPRVTVSSVGPSLGPDDAPVTIVEFSDFNCPYCQRVTPTLKTVHLQYPEQVRIVFRHFPLAMHPRAGPIAEGAACADEQGAFWPYHDKVFEKPDPLTDAAIRRVAESVGVELEAFDACLAAGRGAAVVSRDVADGSAVGVTGTPAFFVNGIKITGAQPFEAFQKLIEAELADAGATSESAPSS